MNICMYACMSVFYAYIRVYMHLCVYACMYICMIVCIHVCIYIIFKWGFERYGWGNCPSWEGELSGGIVRGKCPGEIVQRGNVRAPSATCHRTPRPTISWCPALDFRVGTTTMMTRR